MKKLQWHSSLKKVFKGCDQWWQSNMVNRNELQRGLDELRAELDVSGRYLGSPSTLMRIEQCYTTDACILSGQSELSGLSSSLRWGIAFRQLDFRKVAGKSLPHPGQPLHPFQSSMKAAGPTMLSQWDFGKICAEQLIAVAHKDMAINIPKIRKEGWGRGTVDAFLIGLWSQAYDIPTHYAPVNPLVSAYQQLLAVWRTEDETAFRDAMTAAAEFHIERSRPSTNRMTYEFEYYFDRIYPAELLAVQALRRRDGLPEFDTGHLLVDTPWSILRDLPECEPHPMAVEVEERLKRDFPSFR